MAPLHEKNMRTYCKGIAMEACVHYGLLHQPTATHSKPIITSLCALCSEHGTSRHNNKALHYNAVSEEQNNKHHVHNSKH